MNDQTGVYCKVINSSDCTLDLSCHDAKCCYVSAPISQGNITVGCIAVPNSSNITQLFASFSQNYCKTISPICYATTFHLSIVMSILFLFFLVLI